MNVEIGTEAPDIPFLGIYVSKFRYFVFAVGRERRKGMREVFRGAEGRGEGNEREREMGRVGKEGQGDYNYLLWPRA